jgi:histidyl-tRNA synthetase
VALGCDRIVAAMPDPGGKRLDLFVAVVDADRRDEARRWLGRLRREGLRVEWDPVPGRSLRGQFKSADRSGAGAVAVVGDEWSEGEVTVKRFGTGEGERVQIEEVASWLLGR